LARNVTFNLKFSFKVTHPLKIAEFARSLCHSWTTCSAYVEVYS